MKSVNKLKNILAISRNQKFVDVFFKLAKFNRMMENSKNLRDCIKYVSLSMSAPKRPDKIVII